MKETKCIIPMKEVSLMGVEFHYHIEATVNGKKCWMVVDSGASRTVFDKDMFHQFKNKSKSIRNPTISASVNSNMESDLTTVDSVKIGKLSISKFLTAVIDISNFNRIYESFKINKVCAILGTDILKYAGGVIDFNKKTLSLSFDSGKFKERNNSEVKRIKQYLSI